MACQRDCKRITISATRFLPGFTLTHYRNPHPLLLQNTRIMSDIQTHTPLPPYTLNTEDWGRTRYADAFARQLERVSMRVEGAIGDTLIFTEHEPVFTIGRHKNAEQHIKWTRELLANNGVEVELTNRGGDITYHGPWPKSSVIRSSISTPPKTCTGICGMWRKV